MCYDVKFHELCARLQNYLCICFKLFEIGLLAMSFIYFTDLEDLADIFIGKFTASIRQSHNIFKWVWVQTGIYS